jgi:hypothetical protein
LAHSLIESTVTTSMIVPRDPEPLMVRLLVMSRSPVALASSFSPSIVSHGESPGCVPGLLACRDHGTHHRFSDDQPFSSALHATLGPETRHERVVFFGDPTIRQEHIEIVTATAVFCPIVEWGSKDRLILNIVCAAWIRSGKERDERAARRGAVAFPMGHA